MGKMSDLSKKIGDFEGTFQAKMGTVKDRNHKDLTEAEDIKKRRQEYTEELYVRGQNDLDNHDDHDGVVTRRKLNLLESEAKWPQEASLQTKLVEVLELQLSYFQT